MAAPPITVRAPGHDSPLSSTDRSFRPDIEGLRAVAVAMVLLNHAGWTALDGGFVGVDVFFVLSGFLITGLLLKEFGQTGGISLGTFYARRARRLLPASAIVLAATVLASYWFVGISAGNRAAGDGQWAALFATNLQSIQQGTEYFGSQAAPSPLQHYWSLAVEEQFYLVWPVLIVAVAAIGRRFPIRARLALVLSFVIVASLAWSIHQTRIDPTTAYFSPFPRAFELAAGALVAVAGPWLRRGAIHPRLGAALSWTGLAMVITTGFALDDTTPFPGQAALLPVLGTVLAIIGGTIAPGAGVETVLRLQPFQWLGTLSYSLYLWHWPVLTVAGGWAGRELTMIENLALYVPVVALSALTYVAVEAPIRGSALLGARPPLVSVAFGGALVAVAFGLASGLIAVHALPEDNAPMPGIASAEAVPGAVSEGEFVSEWPPQPPRLDNRAFSEACDVGRLETTSPGCVYGDPDATRTAVIYGDSHAAMWMPAFEQIGTTSNWRIVQLTKPACQVADFPIYSEYLNREYTECAAFRDFAMKRIEAIQPELVIVSSARGNTILATDGEPLTDDGAIDRAWEAGLGDTLGRLAPLTDRLVVLGDVAYASEPGIDCLTDHANDIYQCATPYADAVDTGHNAMEARVASEQGVQYVDVVPWLCTDAACPAIVNGLVTRRDAQHVSENYAVWLSRAVGQATGLLD